MKIRGNTVGTNLKPERVLIKSTGLTEAQKEQARENIGALASNGGEPIVKCVNVEEKLPITDTAYGHNIIRLKGESELVGSNSSVLRVCIDKEEVTGRGPEQTTTPLSSGKDIILRGILPGINVNDAVNKKQMEEAIAASGGGNGGAGIDDTKISTNTTWSSKKVANELDTTNAFIFEEKKQLALPNSYVGKIQAELGENATLYTGTENIVAMCEFAEGENTTNGVTIKIEGNTVTINGTATANINFSLKNHTNGLAHLTSGETPLPERQYTISQYVLYNNGDHIPVFAIRSKQSGLVVSVQGAATKVVDYTEATCGQFYLALTNGKTYDISFVLGVYPMAQSEVKSKIRYQTSRVRAITSSGLADADGYLWAYGDATVLALVPKSYVKRPFCRYENRSISYTGAKEVVDVYIPAKVGYVHIVFGHCYGTSDDGIGYDFWRIISFASVNSGLIERYSITQNGETEMAIKIKGRNDFIGGYTHGDEFTIPGSTVFVLDGEKIDPTTLTGFTEFDELRINEATAMYDPADHITQVGTHGKEYVVTKDGVELNQSVNWLGEYVLDASYMPMFCAIRGNDSTSTLQITDTYIDDGDFIPYDVSTAGFTGYPRNLKTGVNKMTLLSGKSGLCASVSILETPELPGCGTYLFNGDAYNKIYCAVCGYNTEHTTSIGEKWRVRAKIQVEVGNGTDLPEAITV